MEVGEMEGAGDVEGVEVGEETGTEAEGTGVEEIEPVEPLAGGIEPVMVASISAMMSFWRSNSDSNCSQRVQCSDVLFLIFHP